MDGRRDAARRRHRTRLTGRSPGTSAALAAGTGQSSSARQTVVAVQALQISRASSMVPSGSGCSRPPSRQSTWTMRSGGCGRIETKRTRQRRIRPWRGIGTRGEESIDSIANDSAPSPTGDRLAATLAPTLRAGRRARNDAFVPSNGGRTALPGPEAAALDSSPESATLGAAIPEEDQADVRASTTAAGGA